LGAVNAKPFANDGKVPELTRFVGARYDAATMDDEAVTREAPPAPELDDEWEDAFSWSYGPRFWNVGCG